MADQRSGMLDLSALDVEGDVGDEDKVKTPPLNISLRSRALKQYRKLMVKDTQPKKEPTQDVSEEEVEAAALGLILAAARERDIPLTGQNIIALRRAALETLDRNRYTLQKGLRTPAGVTELVEDFVHEVSGAPAEHSGAAGGSDNGGNYFDGVPVVLFDGERLKEYMGLTVDQLGLPTLGDVGSTTGSGLTRSGSSASVGELTVGLASGEALDNSLSSLRVAHVSLQGERNYNEDSCFITLHLNEMGGLGSGREPAPPADGDDNSGDSGDGDDGPVDDGSDDEAGGGPLPTCFAAVYDGHNGPYASAYATTHLHVNLTQEEAYQDDLEAALVAAFEKTDARFLSKARREALTDGTTAVVTLIRGDQLVVANVGDSRAILCRGGRAEEVSPLQTPSREDERDRIQAAGGAVVWFGTWRVNGTLAVSRSIGDKEFEGLVIPTPEIARYTLQDDDSFLLLATDGVWDVLKAQDVVDFVALRLARGHDPQLIAERLAEEAVARKSKDNITILLVVLRADALDNLDLSGGSDL